MSVRVLSWVFEHSTVENRGDLLVLLVLADHARQDGSGAYPSIETLGRKARLSRAGVFDALSRLKADGHILVEGRSTKRTVTYRVSMVTNGPAAGPMKRPATGPLRVQSEPRKGPVGAPEGSSQSPRRVRGLDPNRPEPSREPSKAAAAREESDEQFTYLADFFEQLRGRSPTSADLLEIEAWLQEFSERLDVSGIASTVERIWHRQVEAGDPPKSAKYFRGALERAAAEGVSPNGWTAELSAAEREMFVTHYEGHEGCRGRKCPEFQRELSQEEAAS